MNIIGIRREDKNKWERRVPLTPAHVEALLEEQDLHFLVQPSPIRALSGEDYTAAGAIVQEDLSAADVIVAIKEVPIDLLQAGKTYLFFSHTIKGQAYNMPLLRRLMELECQLIDYERIVDARNRRLIAFGEYAGMAGMVDTLAALGQRLDWEGIPTPFSDLHQTYAYGDLAVVQEAVSSVGRCIAGEGLPEQLPPLVIGIAGYGNVSRGAQAILDLLPFREISPEELAVLTASDDVDSHHVYKVIFKEEDTVLPVDQRNPFDLQEFFEHPERYRSKFQDYLPHLSVLVNCIYWDTPYPRLVTKEAARDLYRRHLQPRLRVIGDISCDIEGGIEPTLKATDLDNPVFVWDPQTDMALDGVAGRGPAIMAVDNLPCELPLESSTAFGDALTPFVLALATCDFDNNFESCPLPPELKRATILYHGQLTPAYRYLTASVAR